MKTRTAVCAAALLLALSMVPTVQAALPRCADINCPGKPCDKRCLSDGGDQITCEEYGQGCQGPGPGPGGCLPPAIITATPNPASVDQPVTLSVTNPSNDLLPHSFNWSFGDGNHSQDGLTVTHTFGSAGARLVFWEGWARCSDGSDKYMSNTLTVGVSGGPGDGEGGPGDDECDDPPNAAERAKWKARHPNEPDPCDVRPER